MQGSLPTMNVTMKDSGADAVINTSDFNEELHEPVDTASKKKDKPKTSKTPSAKSEAPTKERQVLKDDEDDDEEDDEDAKEKAAPAKK